MKTDYNECNSGCGETSVHYRSVAGYLGCFEWAISQTERKEHSNRKSMKGGSVASS